MCKCWNSTDGWISTFEFKDVWDKVGFDEWNKFNFVIVIMCSYIEFHRVIITGAINSSLTNYQETIEACSYDEQANDLTENFC